MTRTRLFSLAVGAATLVTAVGALSTSCSQTPTNIPVRTFELAQRMDTVCIQVNNPDGTPITTPRPVPEDTCAPLAVNGDGTTLPYHLFAAVTQLGRGELAMVDLTAGNVVDEDQSTPGINFVPVGAVPTDVVVAPDAQMTFVASADPTKPAIYGIPNVRILGDSVGIPPEKPLQFTDLFPCALPQPAKTLAVSPTTDGHYVLVATLSPFQGMSAKVVAIDPSPMIAGADLTDNLDAAVSTDASPTANGSLPQCALLGATELSPGLPGSFVAGPNWPDGVPYVDGGVVIPPDAEPPLATCSAAVPQDGGAFPLTFGPLDQPDPTSTVIRDDVPILYVADVAVPVIHVIDLSDPTNPREQAPLLATSVADPGRRVAVGQIAISPPTHDFKRYLYAVDVNDGSVMVYDVTDPATSPRVPLLRPHPELNPFSPLDRISFSGPVATLTFVQHDWPLPSQVEGSNPIHQYTGLLCNPSQAAYPQSNTFNDRGAYYRADQAGIIQTSGTVENFPFRLRGIFAFVTLSNGTIVAIDVDDWDAPCRRPDPMVDGGATVTDIANTSFSGPTNGLTGSLDIPQPTPTPSITTDFDPYHVPLSYNSQVSESAGTTIESFFPVSAPNRFRSNFLLRNDPTSGLHQPNLVNQTLLYDVTGALVATGSTGISTAPLILPTPLPPGFVDVTYISNPTEPNPSSRVATTAALASFTAQSSSASGSVPLLPGSSSTTGAGVRFSFDDPTVSTNENWEVTYEGAIPTLQNVALNIVTYDDYSSLTMATGNQGAPDAGTPDASSATGISASPGLCGAGIEDVSIGEQRANAVLAAIQAAGLPAPGTGAQPSNPGLPAWTSDYVEIADDLLDSNDPYWTIPSSDDQDCWGNGLGLDDPPGTPAPSPKAEARYDFCADQYGVDGMDSATVGSGTVADSFYARDLPIIEAYNDRLVLGRFGWFPNNPTAGGSPIQELPQNRTVVKQSPTNAPFLGAIRCCFHHQATFKVRTGGEWVAVGSQSGYLDHIQPDPTTNRCVLTCNQSDVLKSSRSFDIPWGNPSPPPGQQACVPPTALPAGLDRNSVLAMRNPMFSFVTWSTCTPLVGNDHTETARDLVWKFSTSGGFQPITVSLSQNTSTAVSPQSMRFVDVLGQLAVVDGAQQGLVLIDLNTLEFAHTPYY